MYRIDTGNQVGTIPTPGTLGASPGYFSAGNPGVGQQPTFLDQDYWNMLQESLIAIAAQKAGWTPSKTDYTQLVQGIQAMITAGAMAEQTISGTTAAASGRAYVATAPCTIDIPQSTTLTTNFVFSVWAPGGTVTLQPNAADAINGGAAGASVTVGTGQRAMVLTDAGGNLYVWTSSRTKLAANTTFYLSNSGSDSNNGLTAGTPWATLAHAFAVLANLYDAGGFRITLQLADGTYAGAAMTVPVPGLTPANLIINGDAGIPSNVLISSAGDCLAALAPGTGFTVQNLELTTTAASATNNGCVHAQNGGEIIVGSGIVFGAALSCCHILAGTNSSVVLGASVTIAGNMEYFAAIFPGSELVLSGGITITGNGTPAFTTFFLITTGDVFYNLPAASFAGTWAGTNKYQISVNGTLNTQGTLSAIPGTSSPAPTSGGQAV